MRTSRQRRAEEKKARAVKEINEFVSSDYSGATARCPHGHHMRSHSVLDPKGRIKAVVWSCIDKSCNAQMSIAPRRKSS